MEDETYIDAKLHRPAIPQEQDKKPNVGLEHDATRWKIQDYKLFNGKYPGKFIIFNHHTFNEDLELTERAGTDEDAIRIKKTFENLGFQEADECQENLTFDELIQKLDKVSRQSFDDYGSIVIVILTHGDLGKLYAKDQQYEVTKLWDVLTSSKNANNLAGKPKLFFLQACQGEVGDKGLELTVTDARKVEPEVLKELNIFRIPLFADFLVVFSSAPGYVSFRTSAGSWFIQCLCDAIDQFKGSMDFESILTLVKYDVAVNKESFNPKNTDYHKMKQIPAVSSTLMKKLYLTKQAMEQPQKTIILPVQRMLGTNLASDSDQSDVDSKPVKTQSRKRSTSKSNANLNPVYEINEPQKLQVSSTESTPKDHRILWFLICIILTFLVTCYIISKVQPVNHFHCYQNKTESEIMPDKIEL